MRQIIRVLASDVGARLAWLAAGLALIRCLTAEEFAVLTYAVTGAAMVVAAVGANLNQVYIVGYHGLELSRSPGSVLALEMWLALGVSAAMFANHPLVGPILLLVLSSVYLEHVRAVLQMELKFKQFAAASLARSLAFLASVGLLIGHAKAPVRAADVLLLQGLCTLLPTVVLSHKRSHLRDILRLRSAVRLARRILLGRYLLMMGYFVVLAVLLRVDVMVLERWASAESLAAYGAAFRYFGVLLMLLTAIHTVVLPMAQRAENREQLEALFRSHRKLVCIAIPAVAAGAAVSGWLIPVIDGGRYPGSILLFQILTGGAIVSLACSPHVNLLFRFSDFTFLFGLAVVALAMNLVLSLAWIGRWEAAGVATATSLSTALMNAGIYLRARQLFGGRGAAALRHAPIAARAA